jgi:hypothetical protein
LHGHAKPSGLFAIDLNKGEAVVLRFRDDGTQHLGALQLLRQARGLLPVGIREGLR